MLLRIGAAALLECIAHPASCWCEHFDGVLVKEVPCPAPLCSRWRSKLCIPLTGQARRWLTLTLAPLTLTVISRQAGVGAHAVAVAVSLVWRGRPAAGRPPRQRLWLGGSLQVTSKTLVHAIKLVNQTATAPAT